jgi:hypothetical protein
MNTNEYNESIRREIGVEYGLESAGYAPTPAPDLSMAQAQYLNAKYPSAGMPSTKALLIARRYVGLKQLLKGE